MAGMSAAYHLRGKADSVLICEQKTPAHEGSSSFGDTRMYREMYSDPWLCQVAKKTSSLWAGLEEYAGKQLRSPHGLLFYGEDWGEETIEGSIQGARKVMLEQGISFREYDARNMEKDFPLKSKKEWIGLFEPNAGAVLVEEVFEAWQKAVSEAGFILKTHTSVVDFADEGTQVRVTLGNGDQVFARKLILSAGPWTRKFLPERHSDLDYSVWHMLWAYYTIDEAYRDRFPQWFNFQHKEPDDPNQGLFYGFPSLAQNQDGQPYIKVGIDWTSDELKWDRLSGEEAPLPSHLLQIMDTFVSQYLVGVRDRIHAQLNPYTMSSDVQFCLDKLSDNVALFSHGSGQSFKFAPMIGKCLAALSVDELPPIDLHPWRLERLAA
jgi:sarcosine oxidase